jgi:hypothetical protein
MRGLVPSIHAQLQAGDLRLAPEDHALFRAGFELLATDNPELQVAWIQHVTVARERAVRRDASTFRSERQFLLRWLRGTG